MIDNERKVKQMIARLVDLNRMLGNNISSVVYEGYDLDALEIEYDDLLEQLDEEL